MYATAIVCKTDNGFRGVIQNRSERGLWKVGDEMFNRQFHPFPKGTIMRVLISISPKGRKMVKSVKVTDDPTGIAEMVATLIESSEKEKAAVRIDGATDVKSEPEPEPEPTPAPLPSRYSGYYVSPEGRLIFNTALAMSQAAPQRAVKVMMVGASGYGKTTLPKLFAELSGKQFLRMNCATVRDPEEWFGYREAREGSTIFVRSAFAQALAKGNLVVVLDEFNRLEPWLHNTLFPLLDDDGCTVVHDEKFTIGPGVIVVGTINSGYKYTGTFELDEALLNRFEFILEVGPMPHEEEVKVLTTRTGVSVDTAAVVVKIANILRQSDVVCSTRTSLLVANMVRSGLLVREAFETAVVKRIPVDASGSALRKQVVDLINVELGPFTERTLDSDLFNPPSTEPTLVTKKHRLILHVGDESKLNVLRCVQLVMRLDLPDGKLTLRTAKLTIDRIVNGETITLELASRPLNLDEFTACGLSGRYVSYLG